MSNIRVYKTHSGNNVTHYEIKKETEENKWPKLMADSLEEAAKGAKEILDKMISRSFDKGTIDFKPFHAIEYSRGFSLRCFELTEAEQDEFWLHFIKAK